MLLIINPSSDCEAAQIPTTSSAPIMMDLCNKIVEIIPKSTINDLIDGDSAFFIPNSAGTFTGVGKCNHHCLGLTNLSEFYIQIL